MNFSELAKYLEKLEATSSRLEITQILAELFRKADTSEIDKTCYLILGGLAPVYKGIVFNIAEKMMIDVLVLAYKSNKHEIIDRYKTEGDLGSLADILAQNSEHSSQKSKLSVADVYQKLYEIAQDEGEKSVERKTGKMAELLTSVDPLSARYLVRIPVGKLRLGFSDKTILDALSWMEAGNKSKKPQLEKAFQVVPDVGMLAADVKKFGIERAVKNIKPIVGIPVLPMLAQRLKSPAEMIEKMGKVFVEPKFDGLRVLIHYRKLRNEELKKKTINEDTKLPSNKLTNPLIKAFTRNLNDVTEMFPELQKTGDFLSCNEAILDSEAVGMDPQMIKLLDFQTTMKRRRVHKIDLTAKEIPLSFQVFDVIYCDGASLMEKPYFERRKILEKTVKLGNKLLVVDETLLTENPEVINREYRKNIKKGLEGVIVKKYNARYVPGRTGWRWVKMKQEEEAVGKLSDTVDAVVMGYTVGKGKRAGFGVGQFLVGVVSNSKSNSKIFTLTKIGTGLTDEQFRELKKRLTKLEVKEKPKEYEAHNNYTPDYWVEPKLIVELAGDDLTKSPTHTSGYALRFPRLVNFRDDKSVSEATTVGEIKKLFELQKA